jgi:hypothetical protein
MNVDKNPAHPAAVKKRGWLAKGDAVGQAHFIGELFGLSA